MGNFDDTQRTGHAPLWSLLLVSGAIGAVAMFGNFASPAAVAAEPIAPETITAYAPRLDDGVDWNRVEIAPNPAPMAIAAY